MASDPDKLIAKADKMTKLSLTRWNADWRNATALYEQAGLLGSMRKQRRHLKRLRRDKKCSPHLGMLQNIWNLLQLLRRNWETGRKYRTSIDVHLNCTECGRSQPASDALAKGARALEEAMPDEAIQLYTDACMALEEDGKDQMAFDLYRAATSVYIKLEKYTDAATFLLRLALAADKSNATHSQCKAYLSAIIVYLYAHDFQQAEKCYNDCCQVDAFLNSDQNRAASKLLSAYTDADVEDIKRAAQSSIISNLDHVIIKLARKLPTGDVSGFKRGAIDMGEPLDEDDLT